MRIAATEFAPSASQKRMMKRNADLETAVCRPWATAEQFDLLQTYLAGRHPDGGMVAMDEIDFADMIEHTPVTTEMIEYREPASASGRPGRLVGACLTDRQADGFSMIYSFFDPHHASRKGLGNHIILDHIARAAADGLPFVYLGYWVEGSARMRYKIRFRPMDRLTPQGWRRFSAAEQDALIAEAATDEGGARGPAGGSKDGARPLPERSARTV